MRMIFAVAALVATIASPAFAQSSPSRRPAATNPAPADNVVRHSTNPANDVYVNGRYIGSDPDRNIRFELRRDPDMNDSY